MEAGGRAELLRLVVDKLGYDQRGNQAGGVSAGQKLGHGLPAARAEVQRPVVDVHPHEAVGLGRVQAAADRLAGDAAETVLAVTHGGVIRAMICHLLGLEPRHYVLFNVGYAALAVIDLFDGGGVLSGLQNPDLLPEAVACDPARAAMPWEVGHG